MQISEIFFSIQGESVYSGLPCVFIRTFGCNLNCSYCDTGYAKHCPHSQRDIWDDLYCAPSSILKEIKQFPHTRLVQITGGEPLLQSDIYELFDLLKQNDFQILLETNGTIDLSNIPDYVCKIVDIKTPSSGYPESFLLSNLCYINPSKDNLKFVLYDLNDYYWMKNFLSLQKISGQHILVSTVFNAINPKTIVDEILKDGLDVRFQLQLHKYVGIR